MLRNYTTCWYLHEDNLAKHLLKKNSLQLEEIKKQKEMQANRNDQFPMFTGDITKIHPLLMEGYFSLLRFFIYELLVSTGTI